MAKRRLSAGEVGTTSTRALCGAIPYWVKGDTSALAPRLCCVRLADHKDKKHQDGRGHSWDRKG